MEHKKFFKPCAGSCCRNLSSVVIFTAGDLLAILPVPCFSFIPLAVLLLKSKRTQTQPKSLKLLSNRWFKDHARTAENYQILYAKFHVLFKNIQQKLATFFPPLCFHLHWKKFFCAKPNQKYLNMLQYYSKGCSLANRDTKDPIVMQIRLIARRALSGY